MLSGVTIINTLRKPEDVRSYQLFGGNMPDKCTFETEPDVAEWAYGKYEGMLTKDIRKDKPDWEIWKDGWVRV